MLYIMLIFLGLSWYYNLSHLSTTFWGSRNWLISSLKTVVWILLYSVASNTDFAGYPANIFAGFRIFGRGFKNVLKIVCLLEFCIFCSTDISSSYRLSGYRASRISGRWNRMSGLIQNIKSGRLSGTALHQSIKASSILPFIYDENSYLYFRKCIFLPFFPRFSKSKNLKASYVSIQSGNKSGFLDFQSILFHYFELLYQLT